MHEIFYLSSHRVLKHVRTQFFRPRFFLPHFLILNLFIPKTFSGPQIPLAQKTNRKEAATQTAEPDKEELESGEDEEDDPEWEEDWESNEETKRQEDEVNREAGEAVSSSSAVHKATPEPEEIRK